jgi:hypothetical protein
MRAKLHNILSRPESPRAHSPHTWLVVSTSAWLRGTIYSRAMLHKIIPHYNGSLMRNAAPHSRLSTVIIMQCPKCCCLCRRCDNRCPFPIMALLLTTASSFPSFHAHLRILLTTIMVPRCECHVLYKVSKVVTLAACLGTCGTVSTSFHGTRAAALKRLQDLPCHSRATGHAVFRPTFTKEMVIA